MKVTRHTAETYADAINTLRSDLNTLTNEHSALRNELTKMDINVNPNAPPSLAATLHIRMPGTDIPNDKLKFLQKQIDLNKINITKISSQISNLIIKTTQRDTDVNERNDQTQQRSQERKCCSTRPHKCNNCKSQS